MNLPDVWRRQATMSQTLATPSAHKRYKTPTSPSKRSCFGSDKCRCHVAEVLSMPDVIVRCCIVFNKSQNMAYQNKNVFLCGNLMPNLGHARFKSLFTLVSRFKIQNTRINISPTYELLIPHLKCARVNSFSKSLNVHKSRCASNAFGGGGNIDGTQKRAGRQNTYLKSLVFTTAKSDRCEGLLNIMESRITIKNVFTVLFLFCFWRLN